MIEIEMEIEEVIAEGVEKKIIIEIDVVVVATVAVKNVVRSSNS
jgi:hypothetical protein